MGPDPVFGKQTTSASTTLALTHWPLAILNHLYPHQGRDYAVASGAPAPLISPLAPVVSGSGEYRIRTIQTKSGPSEREKSVTRVWRSNPRECTDWLSSLSLNTSSLSWQQKPGSVIVIRCFLACPVCLLTWLIRWDLGVARYLYYKSNDGLLTRSGCLRLSRRRRMRSKRHKKQK